MSQKILITECPRDAMQGIKDFIPTTLKTQYINELLQVGFDTLDFGSFVSPKAIPQMQDTAEVLQNLDLSHTQTKLLAIVANERGAADACTHEAIHYLGFPLSISETFQQRNTNASIAEAIQRIENIQNLCIQHHKQLTVYLSMGFGNPYGDAWNEDIVLHYYHEMQKLGITRILLADTIGTSSVQNIQQILAKFQQNQQPFGLHLHSSPEESLQKIEAAFLSGCMQYDVAMLGFGGCPMAKDDLVGNIATETLISYFQSLNIDLALNSEALFKAQQTSKKIFLH